MRAASRHFLTRLVILQCFCVFVSVVFELNGTSGTSPKWVTGSYKMKNTIRFASAHESTL